MVWHLKSIELHLQFTKETVKEVLIPFIFTTKETVKEVLLPFIFTKFQCIVYFKNKKMKEKKQIFCTQLLLLIFIF